MKAKPLIKQVILGILVAIGIYALIPPNSEKQTLKNQTSKDHTPKEQIILKVAPGALYNPGIRPYGTGEPLKGFSSVVTQFEALYPDTQIQLIKTPENREYLVTQLSSGSAPDIVYVNVEDVWADAHKGWYIPLDSYLDAPNRFILETGNPSTPGYLQWWDMFKYQALTRGKAGPDGRNYAFTLDIVETGIYYNKTAFNRLGLTVPKTWAEFRTVSETIRQAGKTPLLLRLNELADWATDLIIDQLYYDLLPGIDLISDPTRDAYMQGYLEGSEIYFLYQKGFFRQNDARFREVWKILREIRSFMPRTIVTNEGFAREFINQEGFMYWAWSGFTGRLESDQSIDFEWDIFYLPPLDKSITPYASEAEMCVVGGAASQWEITSSALKDTPETLTMEERMQKSKRLDRAVAFLQLLSLPKNAELVINERPRFLPNIVGVEPLPELKPFKEILERRYTTTKWLFSFDLRFADSIERMFALYLEDGISLDEFIKWHEQCMALAGEDIARKSSYDSKTMDARWKALESIRDKMEGLPLHPLGGSE